MRRSLILVVVSVAVVAAAAVACRLARPLPPPTMVLLVLDTVRADHLSLCGYGRPTSPVLEALAARAAVHCRTYAPGSWTLPSHASFFTGLEPVDHGAHAITSGIDDWSGMGSRSRPLPDGIPTLAEAMAARGYQPLAVSASPVVSETMGLMRGFEASTVARGWGDLYGSAVAAAVADLLTEQADDRPLFLFVNVADAHQPWAAVPAGVDWLPPRPPLHWNKAAPEGPWQRFVEGRMAEDEAAALIEHAVDSYDWAVYLADRSMGEVLAVLEDKGLCEAGCRVVITSDHGEFLGEDRLLDHGHELGEANVRVPVLVWDSRPLAELPSFDESSMSALEVYDLVLEGRRPAQARRASSMAWPHARRCKHVDGLAFCSTSAALWEGDERLLWRDGVTSRGKVVGAEVKPAGGPFEEHPSAARLSQLAERVHRDTRDDHQVDQHVTELLEALGYLD
mgnify:CR=1 FL=1